MDSINNTKQNIFWGRRRRRRRRRRLGRWSRINIIIRPESPQECRQWHKHNEKKTKEIEINQIMFSQEVEKVKFLHLEVFIVLSILVFLSFHSTLPYCGGDNNIETLGILGIQWGHIKLLRQNEMFYHVCFKTLI